MTPEERDAFLGEERTCRVGTIGNDGPHVTALWFVWHGDAVWLTSIVKSQRWTDVQRDPRVTVLVDAGEGFGELRGVEIRGRARSVGEVPRTGEPNDELVERERLFGAKYAGGGPSPTTAGTCGSRWCRTRSSAGTSGRWAWSDNPGLVQGITPIPDISQAGFRNATLLSLPDRRGERDRSRPREERSMADTPQVNPESRMLIDGRLVDATGGKTFAQT